MWLFFGFRPLWQQREKSSLFLTQISRYLSKSTVVPKAKVKAKKKTGKFYAVKAGHHPGIYETWEECQKSVTGFKGAKFKKFSCEKEATAFISSNSDRVMGREEAISNFKKNEKKYMDTVLLKSGLLRSSNGHFVAYTDGCCENNGQMNAVGGIGVYFGPNHKRNISSRLQTSIPTNQKAELEAAIQCLLTFPRLCKGPYLIRTDSQYTLNSATELIPQYKANKWKTSSGRKVANLDYIKRLDILLSTFPGNLKWEYVPSHVGIEGNEKADQLALAGSQKPLTIGTSKPYIS